MHAKLFSISYQRFGRNIQKDFKLALAVICMFFLYRLFLLIYFSNSFAANTTIGSYGVAVLNGMRYDAVVAGYITAIPFLLSLFSLFFAIEAVNTKVRIFFLYFFGIIASILLLSHFLFYLEFNHNFNHLALGIVYDDTRAVLETAWQQYHLGRGLLLAAVVCVAFLLVARPVIKYPFTHRDALPGRSPAANFILGLLWVALYVIMIRGSIGPRPVEPKDAAVTADQHLNSHIINPFMAMLYTVEGHIKMTRVNGIDAFLNIGTINDAAHRYFNLSVSSNLDSMLARYAKGTSTPPKHIYLIIMESMDAWSLLEKYHDFNLLPNLKALGKQGILLKKFLSASSGTMTSLAAIMTGLPDANVITNYQPSSQRPYPTSIAPIFKRLGYKTRLFYGGYLSWQRIEEFCKDQGFDEIYGGGDIGNWRSREWGVDDDELFKFVEKHTDTRQPTFNVILSTTYHSPYDIDIYKSGFPYKEFPDSIHAENANVSVKVFGHLWYTDKVLGEFIRRVHKTHPSSVFAVTGDHRSHNYINMTYTRYERFAVPLLLFGNHLKMTSEACNKIAGSHMDIAPTLIELAAPQGFAYHTFGHDLLDPAREQVGIGTNNLLITPDAIFDMEGNVSPIPVEKEYNEAIALKQAQHWAQRIRDYYALGWWRIMVGPELPSISDGPTASRR